MEAPKLFKDADSRLKGFFGQVTHPTMPFQRTYCFLCGAEAGFCSSESSLHVAPEHIVVTCNNCDAEMFSRGAIPVPQNILDAYGLILDPQAEKESPNVLV